MPVRRPFARLLRGASSLRWLPTLALLLGGVQACAQGIPGYPDTVEGYDPREIGMLPRYCIYTQVFRDRVAGGNNRQMIDSWYAQMGQVFHTMHHYCYGLMKTNRAVYLAQNETTRRFYLLDSLTEFDFVIQRAPADFVLLPEILAKKGENLIRLGKGSVGLLELERAIELNPGYWPPYAHLGDYYKSLGDLKTARDWLERGLAQAPDATGLKRRLSELDAPEGRPKSKR